MLSADDLGLAAAAGLARLTVARLEPGDVGENVAAAMVATSLAGPGTRALPAMHGRCNIAATAAGVLMLDAAMVAAVNGCDEALTLGTLAPMARVAAGEIVATVKTIRYAVSASAIDAAMAAAKPLVVNAFIPRRAVLLTTQLAGLADAAAEKAMGKAVRVTRGRLHALGCTLQTHPALPHTVVALADALRNCGADMVLIAGASASVDRRDVVPAAIIEAGGEVIRLGMPVDPGNLLVLGRLGGRPVIGLPGCARSPKRNGLDIVLERLVAGLAVTSQDIALMGAGGLLPEAERPQPR